MSNELTVEIMKCLGIRQPTTAQVIEFIVNASLTPSEKTQIKQFFQAVEVPDDILIKNTAELEKFLGSLEDLPFRTDKVMFYLKSLPEELDKAKNISGAENLLKITPIEYLNKFDLVNLITKTMNEGFWGKRVTSTDNKRTFNERFGTTLAALLPGLGEKFVGWQEADKVHKDSNSSLEDKILACKHKLSIETRGEWDTETFDRMEKEAGSPEKFLESMEKDLSFFSFTRGWN
jgi:hypothetical protein